MQDEFFMEKGVDHIIESFVGRSGEAYQYLYLYGDTGKTNAVVDRLLNAYSVSNPLARIQRLTGDTFVDDVITSIIRGKWQLFTKLLCACDLLAVSGIEAIAGKEAPMEQLYCILDNLLERGTPFIVTGTTHPQSISGLAPRIRTILEGALIWRVSG